MTIAGLCQIGDISALLNDIPETAISDGYTSDLLSDVVANCPAGAVLLTIQAHANTVAVCTLVEAPAILICGGRSVPEEMLAAAKREGIAVLTTEMTQFQASHAIGKALNLPTSP